MFGLLDGCNKGLRHINAPRRVRDNAPEKQGLTTIIYVVSALSNQRMHKVHTQPAQTSVKRDPLSKTGADAFEFMLALPMILYLPISSTVYIC